ncbi:MAG TPA: carbohydrate ABC transporter permease [Candidatus Handelsmanbacteria bacterium]|nr:carbohydrate ABC transporter permease [Candidatus Handelsmanbacteria bacterium]
MGVGLRSGDGVDAGDPCYQPRDGATDTAGHGGVLTGMSTQRQPTFSRGLVYLALALAGLSTLSAFVWVFLISLKTTTEFLTTSPFSVPQAPSFDNYRSAWATARMGYYFGNSLLAATVGAGVSVLISAFAAYVLARVVFPLRETIARYLLVGYMVPLMLTFVPLFFMMSKMGLASGLLPLVLLYVASGIPFNTFVLRGFFASLPGEMEESAAIDGASPLRTFWQIMMPLAWPGLVSAFLLNFVSLWNEFFLALLFLQKESATLPLGLFYMAEYSAQWTELFAGILLASVPALVIFALLQDHITRGITQGAVKG